MNNEHRDRSIAVSIWLMAILVIAPLFWLLSDVVQHGIGQINWQFLTTAPRNAGRDGGLAPILVSTSLIVLVCLGVSLPLGIGTAIMLAEFSPQSNYWENLWGRLVRLSLDVLAGCHRSPLDYLAMPFLARLLV